MMRIQCFIRLTLRTRADKVEHVFGIKWRSHAKNLRNFICPSDRRERLLRLVMLGFVVDKILPDQHFCPEETQDKTLFQ